MNQESLKTLIRDNPDADDAAILALAGDGVTQDDVTAALAQVDQEDAIRTKAQQVVDAYQSALELVATTWPLPNKADIVAAFANALPD